MGMNAHTATIRRKTGYWEFASTRFGGNEREKKGERKTGEWIASVFPNQKGGKK